MARLSTKSKNSLRYGLENNLISKKDHDALVDLAKNDGDGAVERLRSADFDAVNTGVASVADLRRLRKGLITRDEFNRTIAQRSAERARSTELAFSKKQARARERLAQDIERQRAEDMADHEDRVRKFGISQQAADNDLARREAAAEGDYRRSERTAEGAYRRGEGSKDSDLARREAAAEGDYRRSEGSRSNESVRSQAARARDWALQERSRDAEYGRNKARAYDEMNRGFIRSDYDMETRRILEDRKNRLAEMFNSSIAAGLRPVDAWAAPGQDARLGAEDWRGFGDERRYVGGVLSPLARAEFKQTYINDRMGRSGLVPGSVMWLNARRETSRDADRMVNAATLAHQQYIQARRAQHLYEGYVRGAEIRAQRAASGVMNPGRPVNAPNAGAATMPTSVSDKDQILRSRYDEMSRKSRQYMLESTMEARRRKAEGSDGNWTIFTGPEVDGRNERFLDELELTPEERARHMIGKVVRNAYPGRNYNPLNWFTSGPTTEYYDQGAVSSDNYDTNRRGLEVVDPNSGAVVGYRDSAERKTDLRPRSFLDRVLSHDYTGLLTMNSASPATMASAIEAAELRRRGGSEEKRLEPGTLSRAKGYNERVVSQAARGGKTRDALRADEGGGTAAPVKNLDPMNPGKLSLPVGNALQNTNGRPNQEWGQVIGGKQVFNTAVGKPTTSNENYMMTTLRKNQATGGGPVAFVNGKQVFLNQLRTASDVEYEKTMRGTRPVENYGSAVGSGAFVGTNYNKRTTSVVRNSGYKPLFGAVTETRDPGYSVTVGIGGGKTSTVRLPGGTRGGRSGWIAFTQGAEDARVRGQATWKALTSNKAFQYSTGDTSMSKDLIAARQVTGGDLSKTPTEGAVARAKTYANPNRFAQDLNAHKQMLKTYFAPHAKPESAQGPAPSAKGPTPPTRRSDGANGSKFDMNSIPAYRDYMGSNSPLSHVTARNVPVRQDTLKDRHGRGVGDFFKRTFFSGGHRK